MMLKPIMVLLTILIPLGDITEPKKDEQPEFIIVSPQEREAIVNLLQKQQETIEKLEHQLKSTKNIQGCV